MSSWDAMAELDPLWAILSDPGKKYGKWDPEEFFAIGDQEAQRVLDICRSNGIKVSFEKFLDFGCGVGRMTRAFSRFFEKCIGIDVSAGMIDLAKELNARSPRCEFIASESSVLPFADKSFDCVFSLLVLQHLPDKRSILGYISEFIRVAKDGGAVIFQLTDEVPFRRRIQGRRRVWSALSSLGIPEPFLFRRLGLSPIQMNGICRGKVERFIRENGAQVQAVERYDDPREGRYYSYYYLVVKNRSTSERRSG